MVWPNKFIFQGVDEGEYADAGTTENLRQLRGRVQGTAEKGLGAAGPKSDRSSRLSRVASVIRPESSGERAADSRRSSSQGDGEVGWYREREPLVPMDEGFLYFSEVPMTITAFNIIESTLREGEQFAFAHFTPEQKALIATRLGDFRVEYLELISPSPPRTRSSSWFLSYAATSNATSSSTPTTTPAVPSPTPLPPWRREPHTSTPPCLASASGMGSCR